LQISYLSNQIESHLGNPANFLGGAVSYNFDYGESAEKADALVEIAASA
jgi:hypothetical protein